MTCPNCEALREQNERLRRQMGESFPNGALGDVGKGLGVSWQQARFLLTLYYRDN